MLSDEMRKLFIRASYEALSRVKNSLCKPEHEHEAAALTDEQIEKFDIYGDILLKWNSVMNLTAVTDERDIVIKHYVDSLTLIPYIDKACAKSFADIGTGAGFPGIPVKIIRPELNVLLVDSLAKRVNFLNE